MSGSSHTSDWILEVAGRQLEGTAGAEEIQELEVELSRSPRRLHRYLRFLALHGHLGLTDEAVAANCPRAEADGQPGALVNTHPGRRQKLALLIGFGWIATAAAFLLVWKLTLPQVEILRGVGNQFGNLHDDSRGKDIVGRSFNLTAGFVELGFRRSSATVVIEAPAQFQVKDWKTLLINRGRITAHVRDGKQGLRVLTPDMDVLDLGTQFAVDVVSGRRSEVHVFEGKVEAGTGGSAKSQLLTANNALRVNRGSEPETCELRKESFVGSDELHDLAAGLDAGQHGSANRAFLKMQRDHSLLAAIDFEDVDTDDRITIHGTRQAQGRFPGSISLDFVDVEDRACLDWNVRSEQFTFMTWVRLNSDLAENSYTSLYHTDGWGTPGQVHWMIRCVPEYHGHIRMAIQSGEGDLKATPLWATSNQTMLNKINRWAHLGLTYDSVAQQAKFFINGSLDASVEIPQKIMAVLGPAEIGNWSPNFSKPRRRLCGRMDEMLIFSRVLTAEEIHSYHQESTPYR